MSVTERSTESAQPPADYLAPPPVGEEVHLPGSSLIPFICAIGITLLVIGTTIDWLWSVIGGVILIVTVVMWIRDTRHDVSELPEEHSR